jgi:hypothetical protein
MSHWPLKMRHFVLADIEPVFPRRRGIVTPCTVALYESTQNKYDPIRCPERAILSGIELEWRRRDSALGAIFGLETGERLLRARIHPADVRSTHADKRFERFRGPREGTQTPVNSLKKSPIVSADES